MAAHTKIIDMFGIPACGKSTLSDYIMEHYSGSINIADESDIMLEMKKQARKLLRFSTIGVIIRNLRVRLAAPFDKKRRSFSLRYWISSGLLYHFIKNCTDYDVVIFNHGDIQRFVSLERGDNLHLKNQFKKACSQYIDRTPVFAYVYCKIKEETAHERMRNRGRNKGRIDVINDEKLQYQELVKESTRFDYFASLLATKCKRLIILDMEKDTSTIAEQLMSLIYGKN